MTTQGWYKDEASKYDDASNSGFEKQSDLIKDSPKFQIMGPCFSTFTDKINISFLKPIRIWSSYPASLNLCWIPMVPQKCLKLCFRKLFSLCTSFCTQSWHQWTRCMPETTEGHLTHAAFRSNNIYNFQGPNELCQISSVPRQST